MIQANLTRSEAHLVKWLLELYSTCWEAGPHKHGCECEVCRAVDKAGDVEAAVFDSLEAKADAILLSPAIRTATPAPDAQSDSQLAGDVVDSVTKPEKLTK